MPEVAPGRHQQLEDAYDRKSDPLLSAAYLILAAYEELEACGGPLEQEVRSRLAGLFDALSFEAFRRLDDASPGTVQVSPEDLPKE